MKNITTLLTFFACSFLMHAQTLEIDTLKYNGDSESYINIVVLGDGYTVDELDKFSDDAENFSDYLFSQKPYDSYENFFNVFAIRVPSNESGANHPANATDVSEPVFPAKTVDNVFGSTFDGWGIHRLLVVGKTNAVFSVLADNFPLYDQVIVLVNSSQYGGSGGQFAVSSLNTSANEIAVHEMGHSFVSLIDEYYAGDQYATEGLNMSGETDPSQVKWKNWIGYKQVGIYQHCCGGQSSNWYRPHENCKMRVLGPEFCPVCIEATVERIHHLVPILQGMEPEQSVVEVFDSVNFNIDLKKPDPNTLDVQWILNEDTIASGVDALTLTNQDLPAGTNELIVTVEDRSPYLRIDDHSSFHTQLAIWQVERLSTGLLEISGVREELRLSISPNPTADRLSITLAEALPFLLSVEIYDMNGRLFHRDDFSGGLTLGVDLGQWNSGAYILQFSKGNQVITSRKIVKD